MKFKNLYLIGAFAIYSSLAGLAGQTETIVPTKIETAYSRAANMHLPSLASIPKKDLDINNQSENASALSQAEKLNLCYELFSNITLNDAENKYTESIFEDEVFGDMEMFCGNNKDTTGINLAKVTDQTQTCFGKVFWQSMFTQNIKDLDSHINTIRQRQEVAKYLIENEKLFNAIEEKLNIVEKYSQHFIWFKKRLSELEKKSSTSIYWNVFKSWNNNEFMLEIASKWYLWEYALLNPMLSLISVKFPFISPLSMLFSNITQLGSIPIFLSTVLSINMITLAYDTAHGFSAYRLSNASTKHCTEYTHGSANFISAINEISKLVDQDEKFKMFFPNKNIFQKADNQTPNAKTLTILIKKLKSELTANKQSFFSRKGRTLWCFKKLQELHQEFDKTLLQIGQIDAYMSIARLYKKYVTRKNAKICFAEFKKADMPYISAKSFWYPMVDLVLKEENIVVNDLELGTDELGHNMTLTGPSFSGKSVALKGIMCNVMFSHILGLAFADKFVVTPFAKIGSHLNVSDCTAKGESKYKAEENRIVKFFGEIKKLASMQQTEQQISYYKPFCFYVKDEMLSSTNPIEGEALVFAIMHNLVKYPHCMCLLATHFGKMTQLEKVTNGYFKNYKVWVEEMPDGSMKQPRLIVPGISNQKIAIKMFHNKLSDDVIKNAYDFLVEQGHDTNELVGFKQKMGS